jgi:SAM-dependent methyltransferase
VHLINKVLSMAGLKVERIPKENEKILREFDQQFELLKKNPGEFDVFKGFPKREDGMHPVNYIDYECGFAACHLNRLNPEKILDIGSYRHFIIGALSHFNITSIDVRERKPVSDNETVISSDAKAIILPDNMFDVVMSLCSLEHFGLGRYGDEFDLGADKKAFKEMIRVLKPNGRLIFSTTVTRAKPSIIFNTLRIYSFEMLRQFCVDLICEDEAFFSHKIGGFRALEKITTEPKAFDVYCGCWKKK